MILRLLASALLFCTPLAVAPAHAADLVVPPGAQWNPQFDVATATDAWIQTLPAEQRAKSDAYFEGGYWLQLWNLLWGFGVAALLLMRGRARRLREWTERIFRRRWLQNLLYATAYLSLSQLLGLPLLVYQGWYRERAYGLSTQTFLPWFGEQALGFVLGTVVGAVFIAAIYALVRRMGRHWWIWATGLASVFGLMMLAIAPVFVAPLFNDYVSLPDGPVRQSLLSLARANGIPAQDIYRFDASRQTTRISANVSGVMGTMRISLNDNLLEQTSLPEIRLVMAHEMGHYVLNHIWRDLVYYSVLALGTFFLLHRLFEFVLSRWGPACGVADFADIAGLPLAMALLSAVLFVATPLFNTISRQAEAEADLFGVNAAREPQAMASVSMRLSTYRKTSPGPVEEFLFFDHPGGRARVNMAMQWLKENPPGP